MVKSKNLFILKQLLEEYTDMNYRRGNSLYHPVDELNIPEILEEYKKLREMVSYETILNEIDDFLVNKAIIKSIEFNDKNDVVINISNIDNKEISMGFFFNTNNVYNNKNYNDFNKIGDSIDIVLIDTFFRQNLKYINMRQYILQNLNFALNKKYFNNYVDETTINNIREDVSNINFIDECKKPVFKLFECLEQLI